jgi:tripartite-type tricarboxylate transporter receptor subunit TctC
MPARTPRAIIDRFHDAGERVLATPAMRDKLGKLAVYPMPMTPMAIDSMLAREIAANAVLIREAGIR